jgi:D-serine deaminase-like pyridoxal phosphate-dependent protein
MDPICKKKSDLDTPCLMVDLELLDENLQKMQSMIKAAGKALRPHAKTHKCSTLAKYQLAAGAVGVCAAKISEAEALVEAGISGVLITGPVASREKNRRLVELLKRSSFLMAVVDHPDEVGFLERRLAAEKLQLDVLVDVDVGQRRTGVLPAKALALGELIIKSRHLRLRGIQAYAGHLQHVTRFEERRAASRAALRQAAAVFRKLKAREPACSIFSGSGTGTAEIDLAVPDLTELQAGSYALMDAEYLSIEAADGSGFNAFRPALTLLTTVVSVDHGRQVTVDAGLKSLYKDGGRPQVTTPAYARLHYDWAGDEYGRLSTRSRSAPLPALGETLELVVSHCDPTVNLFDRLHICRAGKVVDVWPIDLRGLSQ